MASSQACKVSIALWILNALLSIVVILLAIKLNAWPEDNTRCALDIRLHSSGKVSSGEGVVTDSLGRKVGYDPVSGTSYDQIPEGYYSTIIVDLGPDDFSFFTETKELGIHIPIEGEYELKVIGTQEGSYDLEIFAYDREGKESYKNIAPVLTSPNTIHTYLFNYSRKVGSKIEVFMVSDRKGH